MDIISYGVASKASKEERHARKDVLGEGVKGAFSNMKERIDAIDDGIANVTKQADKLIVNNAINIMKAHARLNAIAKTKKYNMHQMIFDDLLDLSGVDIKKSSGYTHDSITGEITAGKSCVIETKAEEVEMIPSKALLSIEGDGQAAYFISRDSGETWESITPNTLFHFKDSISPLDNRVKIRAELPEGAKLLNYALTWA